MIQDNLQTTIPLYEWHCDDPKGLIVISHGMMEHARRYADIAKAFNKKGYSVIAADHRGHGAHTEDCDLGDFGQAATWDIVADSLSKVVKYAKQSYPNLDCILLGHSMGSFIAERACQLHPDLPLKGLILMGTSREPSVSTLFGSFLASMFSYIFGSQSKAYFFHTVIFTPYNLSIKNRQTPVDWLSRDKRSNEAYLKDPLCGFVCTNGFYKTLFSGMTVTLQKSSLAKINKKVPIAFFSGLSDPLSRQGAHPKQLASLFQSFGHKVDEFYYDEARHELLHETNKDIVIQDIVSWIDNL